MRLIFALPGIHRYDRGAEIALLAVAAELARGGEDVTVAGSGPIAGDRGYDYVQVPSVRRERFEKFPTFPPFRSETAWEDATFALNLLRKIDLKQYDASVTCSFPFTHWALRRFGRTGPASIFVTQNGDWPAFSNKSEYRTFSCEGLVCTNPDYLTRNADRWNCRLIPNGVDVARFKPGKAERSRLGLPTNGPVVLMVSALIDSKRVIDGIRAVAKLADASLVVAGDGPLRQQVTRLAEQLLPGRFKLVSLPPEDMPDLYRSADVFLHLSLLESFGNVFLEAWASGLPIVAHDSARLRWILGDRHFLCDTTDPRTLYTALKAALSARDAGAPEGIERFSWESVSAQYHEFLLETLAGR
uniref:glycosyltransferase n=1 Tax=Altererythrobacter segetis TaxID=1104773 RepID=UPI001409D291|nr:glycosyltransferase [Altererythrobacter segetis]